MELAKQAADGTASAARIFTRPAICQAPESGLFHDFKGSTTGALLRSWHAGTRTTCRGFAAERSCLPS